MAVKTIGSWMVPQLDVDAFKEVATREIARIDPGRGTYAPERIALAPKVLIGPVVVPGRDLNVGTIVPAFDERMSVDTLPMERVAGYVPESIYSPAPTSIYGIGPQLGTILVMLGKIVVAEIAADVTMDTMQRIGQRVLSQYRIRGRTVTADVARHVAVRGGNLRSGFLPDRKHYDQPCSFWEFWCWLW